jgi:hypothetical protein
MSALIANVTFFKVIPSLRQLVACFPPQRPGFEPRSGYVGFLLDKMALGQVFSEYFGFLVNSHSTDCSTLIIYHPGLVQ